MQLAARTAAWAKSGGSLPYLRRLEYIESRTGNNAIRTGVFCNLGKNRIICTVAFTEVGVATSGSILGAYGNLQVCCRPDSTLATGGLNSGGIPYTLGDNVVCENYVNNNGKRELKVGESVSTGTAPSFSNQEFIAFAQPQNGGVWNNPTRARLYEAKIYLDDDLIFDAIPVLDLSGVPCLYDQVQSSIPVDDPSRFHYNAGTGTFDYWPNN